MDCNLNVIDAVERTLVDIRNDTEFIDDLVWEFLQQRFDIGQPNGCPIIRSADIQDASLSTICVSSIITVVVRIHKCKALWQE